MPVVALAYLSDVKNVHFILQHTFFIVSAIFWQCDRNRHAFDKHCHYFLHPGVGVYATHTVMKASDNGLETSAGCVLSSLRMYVVSSLPIKAIGYPLYYLRSQTSDVTLFSGVADETNS